MLVAHDAVHSILQFSVETLPERESLGIRLTVKVNSFNSLLRLSKATRGLVNIEELNLQFSVETLPSMRSPTASDQAQMALQFSVETLPPEEAVEAVREIIKNLQFSVETLRSLFDLQPFSTLSLFLQFSVETLPKVLVTFLYVSLASSFNSLLRLSP